MPAVIKKISQTTTADANGRAIPAIAVEYTVGSHGPFTETFPKTEFTAQTVAAKLAEVANHIEQLK